MVLNKLTDIMRIIILELNTQTATDHKINLQKGFSI